MLFESSNSKKGFAFKAFSIGTPTRPVSLKLVSSDFTFSAEAMMTLGYFFIYEKNKGIQHTV